MSKVEILRLDSVTTNDTKATALINTNFQNIQNVIETLLSRTGATPNYMDAVLDMNSYRIINTAAPVEDFDVVNLKYLKDYVGNLESLVNQALEAAEAALVNAQNAAGSANVAASASQTAIEARDAAVDAAILAQGIERDIEGLLNDPNLVAVGEDLRDPDGKINTVLDAAQELNEGKYGYGLEFEDSYLQLLDKNGEALGDPVLINQGNYKGEYSATTTYNTGDYVHYSSPYAFYMCQSGPATGIAPEGDPLSRTTWISGNRTHVEPASNNASYHIALAGDPYIQYPDSVYLYASENAPKINASTGDIIGYAKTSDLPDTSKFVTTNTAQTISGQKTFSSTIRCSSTIDQSATTGEVETGGLTVYDKNGTGFAYFNASRSSTTNTNRQRVRNKNIESTANWFDLRASVTDAGNGYASIVCGSDVTNYSLTYATASTSGTYIPTMGWVNNPNYSQNVVHRSGAETITGQKTFSSTTQPQVVRKNANQTLSTATSEVVCTCSFRDSTDTPIGVVGSFVSSSGSGMYMQTAAWANNKGIRIKGNYSDKTTNFIINTTTTQVTAPTEDTTSSTQIDTVGARNTKLQSYATTAYVDNAATSASNFKGEYDATATYNIGDYVWWVNPIYMYICVADNTTGVLPSHVANWRALNDTYAVRFKEVSDNNTYRLGLASTDYSGDGYAGPVRFTTAGPLVNAQTGDIVGYQKTSNLVTSVDSTSTDDQYPSAKLFYDTCGDIETLINAL